MVQLKRVYEMPSGMEYEGVPDGTRASEFIDVQTTVDAAVAEVFPPESIDDPDKIDLDRESDACIESVRTM